MPLNDRTLQLFKNAFAKRESLRKITNAIRLVNGKGDLLDDLLIEQYANHFVAQIYHPRWLEQAQFLTDCLQDHFQVDYFILKDRCKDTSANPDAFKSHVLVANKPSKTIIQENGLKFEVDLNNGLNSGLFLDMRQNKLLIAQSCKDKKVLNCFSYSCSFGVYAKHFGAYEVINVDISKKILELGKRNYELNDLTPGPFEMVKLDTVKYLERAVKKDNCFDIIIIDPPTFARVEGKVFHVQKALPKLIENALHVLNPHGKLFVSSNLTSLSHNHLEHMLKVSSRIPKKIHRLGQDKDFVGSGLIKESYLAAIWAEF